MTDMPTESDPCRVIEGDSLAVLSTLAAGAFDAVVTDPPYALNFMNCRWDAPGTVFCPETWEKVLNVLKPGGCALVFGGTRTYHRLTCAIEDAGFEVRDSLAYLHAAEPRVAAFADSMTPEQRGVFAELFAPAPTLQWLFGTGFPKGKGCLKPAYEPIVLARRPGPRVLPLGIDECRIGLADEPQPRGSGDRRNGAVYAQDEWTRTQMANGGNLTPAAGRWPANVCHDGSDEVLEAFAAFGASDRIDRRTETLQPRPRSATSSVYGVNHDQTPTPRYTDSGTAARFYYCAKASRAERDAGCEELPAVERSNGNKWTDQDYRVARGERTEGRESGPRRNTHPTVKPLALMSWLVKLVCPPGGILLDPFAGSGTTLVAAAREGRRAVGIEREANYVEIARRRVAAARADGGLFGANG